MKKQLIKIISALLCLLLLGSVTAFAAEGKASSLISMCSATMAVKSNGDLKLSFDIVATDVMDSIGASTIVIERHNGTKWVTERTYSVENYPNLQTSQKTFYNSTLEFTPLYSGKDYRAVITFYVESGTEIAEKTVTSNTITT